APAPAAPQGPAPAGQAGPAPVGPQGSAPAPATGVAPGTAPQAQARPLGPKPRSAPDETRTVLAPVPGGLTAEVVAERSLASSHTVRARLAELDAARARLDQTTAQFFPRLTLRASYTRLSPVSAELGGALVGA